MKPYFLKTLIITLVISSISSPVYPLSPKSALKSVNKHYSKTRTIQADFKELFEWILTGETVVQEGSIVITRDNRFRIDTPKQLLVSDGEAIFRYNKVRKQVTIEPVISSGEPLLPQKLLFGFAKKFQPVNLEELPVTGRKGFRLDLVPLQADMELVEKVTLWVTEDDFVVHRLKTIDVSGNSTTFFLDKLRFDEVVDKEITTFTIPDGVEVFDLR